MPTTFAELIGVFMGLIWQTLPVLVGLATLVFIWGLVKFIHKSKEQDITDGKKLIIWGLIALFVLFSFWAIIAAFYRDVGFSRPFGLPLLPT